MSRGRGSTASVAAVAALVLLAALAGCTSAPGAGDPVADANATPPSTTTGSMTTDGGPAITGPPERPPALNETSAAAYVEAFEEARRHDATVRHARNSSDVLRWVSVSARTRVVGRTPGGGFLVEAASGGGAGYRDESGRNVSSDWGLPTRSLYYVTPNATARVPLPRNWSTTTGRVVLVNFEEKAVHAGFQWGTKPVPAMTMNVVGGGNSSTLGVVNASETPKNATVAVGEGDVTPTVRVEQRGQWTETGVFVVVLPDGSVTVTRGYTIL